MPRHWLPGDVIGYVELAVAIASRKAISARASRGWAFIDCSPGSACTSARTPSPSSAAAPHAAIRGEGERDGARSRAVLEGPARAVEIAESLPMSRWARFAFGARRGPGYPQAGSRRPTRYQVSTSPLPLIGIVPRDSSSNSSLSSSQVARVTWIRPGCRSSPCGSPCSPRRPTGRTGSACARLRRRRPAPS